MGNISETTNNLAYHYYRGKAMTPETKAVLQTLLKYRDEYYGMWLKKAADIASTEINLIESARFLGQAQGLRTLTDLMLIHYKTNAEAVNAK